MAGEGSFVNTCRRRGSFVDGVDAEEDSGFVVAEDEGLDEG